MWSRSPTGTASMALLARIMFWFSNVEIQRASDPAACRQAEAPLRVSRGGYAGGIPLQSIVASGQFAARLPPCQVGLKHPALLLDAPHDFDVDVLGRRLILRAVH